MNSPSLALHPLVLHRHLRRYMCCVSMYICAYVCIYALNVCMCRIHVCSTLQSSITLPMQCVCMHQPKIDSKNNEDTEPTKWVRCKFEYSESASHLIGKFCIFATVWIYLRLPYIHFIEEKRVSVLGKRCNGIGRLDMNKPLTCVYAVQFPLAGYIMHTYTHK